MAEFDLIEQYFKPLSFPRKDILLGINDDCAIVDVPDGQQLAVTTDTLIEGVHFPSQTSARDVGYKSLAVNLSDLAAMGAEPAWVTLCITLPEANEAWLAEFAAGFAELLKEFNVVLVGGDTTRGPLSISVQAAGYVDNSKAMKRHAAQSGDLIYVTGTLGDAGLGLAAIKQGIDLPYCRKRLDRPTPRVSVGLALCDVSYCAIDISDGLLSDLGHIVQQSQCSASIELDKLPLSDELKKYYGSDVDWQSVLSSGDDYELCFTVPPDKKTLVDEIEINTGVKLTCIGCVQSSQGIVCKREDGSEWTPGESGYNHFK